MKAVSALPGSCRKVNKALVFSPLLKEHRLKMSKKKTIGVAVGSAFVAGMSLAPMANAADNPFALHGLQSGYMVAEAKAPDGKCGQGKCGGNMMDLNKDGKISKEEFMKSHETMYGPKDGNKAQFLKAKEAEFAARDKNHDGFLEPAEEKAPFKAVPAAPKASEGKCGQGKCGAMPKK
jgi:uncharacterized low-complexity protein